MDDKIIITNRGALQSKYGSSGYLEIVQAIADLTAADKKRGIETRLIAIDDPVHMKRCRGTAVTDRRSFRQNKQAIDAVFKALEPDYLMILGSTDVIPHQDLTNAAFDAGNDDDELALGDLPYACEAAHSNDPARFVGPTRVVGRLPDLTAVPNGKPLKPTHLIRLLKTASAYKQRSQADYGSYFALSTRTWRASTALSLAGIFGNDASLRLAPRSGPDHPASALKSRAHFINCHGAIADPTFYGEGGHAMPRALTTRALQRKISPGTVAAVECCYGAELYDSVTLSLDMPICQQYLGAGAYGYFGSTTIAYGPAEGNGAADLIAQYFLLAILDGASIGRAALVAQQRFVTQTGQMDPIDLKTLAQFCLFGDPSIHPVHLPNPTQIPGTIDAEKAMRVERRERRAKLRASGELLQKTKPTASKLVERAQRSPVVNSALRNIARTAGIPIGAEFKAFAVKAGAGAARNGRNGNHGQNAKKVATNGAGADRYYVVVRSPAEPNGKRLNLGTAIVAKELDKRIVGYRVYHQR